MSRMLGQALTAAPTKRKGKIAKLPVPPPKHPEASAASSDGGIPPFLDRKLNGIKTNPPTVVKTEADVDREARKGTPDLRAKQAETKKAKARVRIEKLKAQKSGATKQMPLSDKAALQAIAKAAVENGHPIKKVPMVKANPTKPKTKAKNDGPRKGSKLEIIHGLLTRKQGCTTADVLKACDWPAVSMPQQAKALGLKLKKEKDGKVTRYRAS